MNESMMDMMDFDEPVIIRLDNFFPGNIFVDEGMVAVLRFDNITLRVDISGVNKLNLLTLFDLFEEQFSNEYYNPLEIYAEDDYLSLAKDCIAKVPNKSVRRFCRGIYQKLEREGDFKTRIELLDKLLIDSTLSPEELSLKEEENCLYRTERSLFKIRSRRSSKKNTIYRFTIAKKVYHFLQNKEGEYTVRIELSNSNTKILFIVYDHDIDKELKFTESRGIYSNNDGSVRVNFPPTAYERIKKHENELDLFIYLKNNKIVFSFYE